MNVKSFKQLPILGILRGISKEAIEPLVEAVCASGLKTIEITMNTDSADSLIRQAVKVSRQRLTIGAGTVTTMKTLKTALSSGATFIEDFKRPRDFSAFGHGDLYPGAGTRESRSHRADHRLSTTLGGASNHRVHSGGIGDTRISDEYHHGRAFGGKIFRSSD